MNNMKYFLIITIIAVCIIIIGKLFFPVEREEINDKSHEGQKVFYRTYVIPVVMDDGTKCVVVAGGRGSRGISCEWRNK